MSRIIKSILLILAFFIAPTTAFSQTITVQQTSVNAQGNILDGFETRGQAFLVPVGAQRLSSFTLRGRGDVTPVVRSYNLGTNSIGGVLFTGTPRNIPFTNEDITTVIPGGITVVPGDYIFIGLTQNAPGLGGLIVAQNGNPYSDGIFADLRAGAQASIPDFDAYFIANFNTPAAIPTMSEWAMILFGLILAAIAALFIQRNRLIFTK